MSRPGRSRKRKFVIVGNNGNSLISNSLTELGWTQSEDEKDFTLKWTELKSRIDYDGFNEGKQLVNHIPSSGCITTKSGLLYSLRSYFGHTAITAKDPPENELHRFFPETYRLGEHREREKLLSVMGESEKWICKPSNANQGKGIFILNGKSDLLAYIDKRSQNHRLRSSRIVQRYIDNPLLVNGRKFDIRVYLFVGSTRPYNVFFHTGYLRLTIDPPGRSRKRKFVIVGNNGNSLISNTLTELGWTQSEDENDFTLKWTELKSRIDYDGFNEGKQLVNHIPSSGCITTKSGLLYSLRSYFGHTANTAKDPPENELHRFFPETYRLGEHREREKLLSVMGESEKWICKPSNANQGKGIFILNGKSDLLAYIDKRSQNHRLRSSRIVQRYIDNPLLVNGRKFDIRVYLFVGSTRPYNVFFHTGYLRLTIDPYDTESTDMATHLTNQYMQKKHPKYSEEREDTVWDMGRFSEYLRSEGVLEKLGLPDDWVETTLHDRMKSLALTVFKSAQSSLTPRLGYFDLYGLDFMLDDNLNVWLIEVNTNPALHTNCGVLEQMLPSLINETLGISIELFDKKRSGEAMFPIQSANNFELLFTSAKDAMIARPLQLCGTDTKQQQTQLIYRGSELAPIKCQILRKPPSSKSAPTRRSRPPKRTPSERKPASSTDTASTVSTVELDRIKEAKQNRESQPLKMSLIEVAPKQIL
eukprot:sb/3462599/